MGKLLKLTMLVGSNCKLYKNIETIKNNLFYYYSLIFFATIYLKVKLILGHIAFFRMGSDN